MANNKEIRSKNKQELRTLENMYVNSTLDNLEEIIKEKKDNLTDKLIEYVDNIKRVQYTKEGDKYYIPNVNPIIIQNYFFKSINPIGNKEPAYNAEKLALIFELYSDIVAEINIKIGDFIPNVSSFCTFAGITTSTFNTYKKSADVDLRVIYEKINDYCFNNNVTMAQDGRVREKSTMYRMKVEQEKSEKTEPQIHIHTDSLDMGLVQDRLRELQEFNKTKENSIPVESSDGK